MAAYGSDHYLDTPEGQLARYRKRRSNRLYFSILGIEPRAKHSMKPSDKLAIQGELLKSMLNQRRRAFRGPIALKLRVQTSERTPTHSHHIAKNYLDLFGKPLVDLGSRRRGLLYADDRQVHALSVSCSHGEPTPQVWGEVRPLTDLLEDLDIGAEVQTTRDDEHRLRDELDYEASLDHFNDLRRDPKRYIAMMGQEPYEAWLRSARQRAQETLFSRVRLETRDLSRLHDVAASRHSPFSGSDLWEQMFSLSPLRIRLSELPHVNASSAKWKAEIDDKLASFRRDFAWLLEPLLTPLALEVVIRPPAVEQGQAHDLDNVLRTYLIPRVFDALKPISHVSFATDFEALARVAPMMSRTSGFAEWVAARRTPPATTRVGVTRYEVWRLPPAAAGSRGFVSVALAADMSGFNDVMTRLDEDVQVWADSLASGGSARPRRRTRW